MDRRHFLVLGALSPLAVKALTNDPAFAATPGAPPVSPGSHSFSFAEDGSAFLLDGKPFQIRSGEMHPARIPVEYWRHRIRMAKAMGMNTISLYLMWNYLEERPGDFDLRGERRDFVAFVRLCQEEGMWVLLRPGPYVCGEWDLGGIPPYLLRHSDVELRVRASEDPHYMSAVTRYVDRIAPHVASLMVPAGGPVLMVQIENEYGSYGDDSTYLDEIRRLWTDRGIRGPFYTEDGLSQLERNHTNVPGGAIALSGGDPESIATAREEFPSVPAMGGEVYSGWLTHWGDSGFAGGDADVSDTITGCMERGLSFNLYVIHGGTSFGYFAGANANDSSGSYQPDITSYDYGAPITEQGARGPRYDVYRGLIAGYLDDHLPAVPDPVPTITSPRVPEFTPTPYASLWDNLPAPLPAERTVHPRPFEHYGQNSGFVLYRKRLAGYSGGRELDIRWVHDYATVFLDGRYVGGFSRPAIPADVSARLHVTNGDAPLSLPEPAGGSEVGLDVLVEGMGHTNYGHALVDRKGILQSVMLRDAGSSTGELTGWQVFLLPMDEKFVRSLRPHPRDPSRPGLFFRSRLHLTEVGDTYLDVSRWTKGLVWVNGHNLGRYWEIGPQHRLYCPAGWLHEGNNEIVLFDMHRTEPAPISFHSALS